MDKSPLDVAIVTPRFPPISNGGGQRSAELLATKLAESERIEAVTVYAFDGKGEEEGENITVRRLGSVSSTITEYQNVIATWQLRNWLSDHDLIHGYNMELNPAIGYLGSKLEVPSVATLNSYHFFRSFVTNTTAEGLERLYELIGYPTTGRVLRHFMGKIDVFIVMSEATERIYRANGYADARFESFPNMLDPEFSVPDRKSPDDRFDLLYVGTLTENKGLSNLIHAMTSLSDDFHLRVAGSGPQEEALKQLVTDLGVEDCIDFEGWVGYDRIGELYATSDLFVHPGIWPEPFNRTILEAMQAGLPIVCTDIGGPPEAISDDRFLCEPDDPASLARAIDRAAEADENLGEANQKYVKRHHAPAKVVPALIDLYENLVHSRQ